MKIITAPRLLYGLPTDRPHKDFIMEQAVNILIVEDEFIIAGYMEQCLTALGYRVAGICHSYEKALAALEAQTPDMALIDITLKGEKTGIQLAEHIRSRYGIPFIFITSLSDKSTVDTAKKTLPYAYLIKPFAEEDLYAAVETAFMQYSRSRSNGAEPGDEEPLIVNDCIFIKHKNKFVRLPLEDMLYLEANDNYTTIFTAAAGYTVKNSLKNLAAALPGFFVRTHRSYLVNLKQLKSFDTEELTIGGKTLPIGKSFYPDLLARLKIVQG